MSSSPIDYRRPSRPRRSVPSRIPKPAFALEAIARGETGPGPSNPHDTAPSPPPSTPRPLAKLDAAFTAAVDASRDASWLIAARPGPCSDITDSLLEAAEWRECEDDGRSLHSHYDESDLDDENEVFHGFRSEIEGGRGGAVESRGSCSPEEEEPAAGLWGPRAALEAVAGRLGRLAWTLEWVEALRAAPCQATPRTPPAAAAPTAPPGGGPSGGSGGSCRSLSAAFERAAMEPAAFHTSAARESGGGCDESGSDDGGSDCDADFASACSASVADSSEPSEADSEELHASLGTSVSAAATASEWLSGGTWDARLPPPP